MADSEDIRVQADWPTHPKTLRLLRAGGEKACFQLISLWCWVRKHRPDGDIGGLTGEDIEAAAGVHHSEKPGLLIESLVKSGFLDEAEDGYELHDWEQWQVWSVGASTRSERSRFSKYKGLLVKAGKWREEFDSFGSDELRAVYRDSDRPAKRQRNANETLTNASKTLGPSPSPSPSPSPTPIRRKNLEEDTLVDSAKPNSTPSPFEQQKATQTPQGHPAWMTELLGAWSTMAGERGLAGATGLTLTSKRRKNLEARPRAWRPKALEAIERIRVKGKPFMFGSEGWKADFSWFLKPDTVAEILEGRWDDAGPRKDPREKPSHGEVAQEIADGLQDYGKRMGLIPKSRPRVLIGDDHGDD